MSVVRASMIIWKRRIDIHAKSHVLPLDIFSFFYMQLLIYHHTNQKYHPVFTDCMARVIIFFPLSCIPDKRSSLFMQKHPFTYSTCIHTFAPSPG